MFSFPSVTHWQGELYPSSVCQQWTIRRTLSYNPYDTEHLLPAHFCRVWKPSLALQLLWVAGRRHLPHRFPVDLHLPVPLHAHLPSTGDASHPVQASVPKHEVSSWLEVTLLCSSESLASARADLLLAGDSDPITLFVLVGAHVSGLGQDTEEGTRCSAPIYASCCSSLRDWHY